MRREEERKKMSQSVVWCVKSSPIRFVFLNAVEQCETNTQLYLRAHLTSMRQKIFSFARMFTFYSHKMLRFVYPNRLMVFLYTMPCVRLLGIVHRSEIKQRFSLCVLQKLANNFPDYIGCCILFGSIVDCAILHCHSIE